MEQMRMHLQSVHGIKSEYNFQQQQNLLNQVTLSKPYFFIQGQCLQNQKLERDEKDKYFASFTKNTNLNLEATQMKLKFKLY